MIMDNVSLNTIYQKIDGIKKAFLEHENTLNPSFNEATILPIPDDAPLDIPRIIVTTKHEHTQLNIAPEAASMITQFTDEYVNNWDLCKDYVENKSKELFDLFDGITNADIKYIGVVTNLIWSSESYDNEKIYSNLFGKKYPEKLDDLLVKYTFIEDEKYYANITIQGMRTGDIFEVDNKKRQLMVTLDVNDRFMHNIDETYRSNREKLEKILEITDYIIKYKLENLIEKGTY